MKPNRSRLVCTKGLAQLTGTSASFWEKRRVNGLPPAYYKLGGRVLYELADIETWLSEQRREPLGGRDA